MGARRLNTTLVGLIGLFVLLTTPYFNSVQGQQQQQQQQQQQRQLQETKSVHVKNFKEFKDALDPSKYDSSLATLEIKVLRDIPTLESTLHLPTDGGIHVHISGAKTNNGGRHVRIGSYSTSGSGNDQVRELFRLDTGAKMTITNLELATEGFRDQAIANWGGEIQVIDNVKFIGYGDAFVNRNSGVIGDIVNCEFDRQVTDADGSRQAREQIRNLASGTISTIQDTVFKQTSFGGAIANRGTIGSINNVQFLDSDNHSDSATGRSVSNSAIDHFGTIDRISNCEFKNLVASGKGAGIRVRADGHIQQIKSVKFTNCEAGQDGGAIHNEGVIEDGIAFAEFENCVAKDGNGGGISAHADIGQLSHVRFIGCEAKQGRGGGMFVRYDVKVGATGPISHLTFQHCASKNGGALAFRGAQIASPIENSEFSDNSASLEGGAIAGDTRGAEFEGIQHCTFQANTAGRGGAISLDNRVDVGSTGFRDNVFIRNKASSFLGGGAIFIFSESGYSVIGNQFYGNSGELGGAIRFYLNSNANQVSNNTFENNDASNSGAGVYLHGEIAEMTGNLFRENSAKRIGGAIYLDDGTIGTISKSVFYKNSVIAIQNHLGRIDTIDRAFFVANQGVAFQSHYLLHSVESSVFIGDRINQYGQDIESFTHNVFSSVRGGGDNAIDYCTNVEQTGTKCPECNSQNDCKNGDGAESYCSRVNAGRNGVTSKEKLCLMFSEYGCAFDGENCSASGSSNAGDVPEMEAPNVPTSGPLEAPDSSDDDDQDGPANDTPTPTPTLDARAINMDYCTQSSDKDTCEAAGCTWYASVPRHWANCRPECHFPGNRRNCVSRPGCKWDNGDCVSIQNRSPSSKAPTTEPPTTKPPTTKPPTTKPPTTKPPTQQPTTEKKVNVEICSQESDKNSCEASGCTWYASVPRHWVNCRPECHFPGNRRNCAARPGCKWDNGDCVSIQNRSSSTKAPTTEPPTTKPPTTKPPTTKPPTTEKKVNVEICSQESDKNSCEASGCTWYDNVPRHWINCRPECHFPGNKRNCEARPGCKWDNGDCVAERRMLRGN